VQGRPGKNDPDLLEALEEAGKRGKNAHVLVVLQGTVYPVVDLALRSFTPSEIAFARVCLAALTIGVFSKSSSRRITIRKEDFFILCCASISGTSIFYVLQGYSVELASPNETSFLMATYPLLASILARVILGARYPFKAPLNNST
jgi:drug/metabolite transporter (DMT)-like permease